MDVPNVVFDMKHTPIFEWSMVGCESRNIHQKYTCWKETRLCAKILLTILDAIVNIIGGGVRMTVYDPINRS